MVFVVTSPLTAVGCWDGGVAPDGSWSHLLPDNKDEEELLFMYQQWFEPRTEMPKRCYVRIAHAIRPLRYAD